MDFTLIIRLWYLQKALDINYVYNLTKKSLVLKPGPRELGPPNGIQPGKF